jgi:hypothetical protein
MKKNIYIYIYIFVIFRRRQTPENAFDEKHFPGSFNFPGTILRQNKQSISLIN